MAVGRICSNWMAFLGKGTSLASIHDHRNSKQTPKKKKKHPKTKTKKEKTPPTPSPTPQNLPPTPKKNKAEKKEHKTKKNSNPPPPKKKKKHPNFPTSLLFEGLQIFHALGVVGEAAHGVDNLIFTLHDLR